VTDAVVGHCISGRYDNFVFADGAVGTSLGGENGATPATGSLGFRHLAGSKTKLNGKKTGLVLRGEEFRALLALANLVDTLRGQEVATFSRTLLLPTAVGGAGSGDFMYRRFRCKPRTNQEFGIKGILQFAKTTWAFDSVRVDGTHFVVANDLTAIAFAGFIDWVAVNQFDSSGNVLAFTVDVGGTLRGFAGNASADTSLRSHALQTTQRWFAGPALSVALRFRNIVGKADVTWLRPSAGNVAGLTGLQSIVGFSLEAPMFSFATKANASPPLPPSS
jgi:hypothetical protein